MRAGAHGEGLFPELTDLEPAAAGFLLLVELSPLPHFMAPSTPKPTVGLPSRYVAQAGLDPGYPLPCLILPSAEITGASPRLLKLL